MKKVLFISHSYPSLRSANVLCDTAIIKEMQRRGGYDIHYLVFENYRLPAEENVDGVSVHRFKRGWIWNVECRAEDRNKTFSDKLIIKLMRLKLRIKQTMMIPFFPIVSFIVISKTARAALRLQKQYSFDLVLSDHYGIETVLAGYNIKKHFPAVIWVPLFWDSMSGGFPPKYLPKKYTVTRRKRLEKKLLRRCDTAIAMRSHRQNLERLWQGDPLFRKFTFLDIPYLVIQDKLPTVSKHSFLSDNTVNILFAGNMGMRNAGYFLKVAAALPMDVTVWFYTSKCYHKKVRCSAPDGVAVQVRDYVSHDVLEKILAETDILLNFGVDNPNAISGKIFEYIGYKKPIISTYFIDNEAAASALQDYPLAFLLDEREPDIALQAARLAEFIEKARQQTVEGEYLARAYADNLPSSYVDLTDALLKEKGK